MHVLTLCKTYYIQSEADTDVPQDTNVPQDTSNRQTRRPLPGA